MIIIGKTIRWNRVCSSKKGCQQGILHYDRNRFLSFIEKKPSWKWQYMILISSLWVTSFITYTLGIKSTSNVELDNTQCQFTLQEIFHWRHSVGDDDDTIWWFCCDMVGVNEVKVHTNTKEERSTIYLHCCYCCLLYRDSVYRLVCSTLYVLILKEIKLMVKISQIK